MDIIRTFFGRIFFCNFTYYSFHCKQGESKLKICNLHLFKFIMIIMSKLLGRFLRCCLHKSSFNKNWNYLYLSRLLHTEVKIGKQRFQYSKSCLRLVPVPTDMEPWLRLLCHQHLCSLCLKSSWRTFPESEWSYKLFLLDFQRSFPPDSTS